MECNFKQLFKRGELAIPAGLQSGILISVRYKIKKAHQIQTSLWLVLDLTFLASLVLGAVYLGNLLGQSGFYYYLTTLWSDSGSLPVIWLDVIYSLASTLPALGLAVFLTTMLAFVWSTIKTINNLKYLIN